MRNVLCVSRVSYITRAFVILQEVRQNEDIFIVLVRELSAYENSVRQSNVFTALVLCRRIVTQYFSSSEI